MQKCADLKKKTFTKKKTLGFREQIDYKGKAWPTTWNKLCLVRAGIEGVGTD